MNTTFKRNLIIGFGVSLLLLIISSVASFTSIKDLNESARWVDHTAEVIQRLEEINSRMKDAETGQRGYLLTGEEVFLDPYRSASDSVARTLESVKRLTADNPMQQQSCDDLELLIGKVFTVLNQTITKGRAGTRSSLDTLLLGKQYMDQARVLIGTMEARERQLMIQRTEARGERTNFTLILIVIAAVLALLITSVFYMRVKKDVEERERLQGVLQDKDEDITRRIGIIRQVAEQISSGDYTVRVNDGGADGLGNVAISLNRMAGSLEASFTQLEEREWLQASMAQLNDRMVGEKDTITLCKHIVETVADLTHSQVGALYLCQDQELVYTAGYAFAAGTEQRVIPFGEGLAGQSALSGKLMLLPGMQEDHISISYATGKARPVEVVAIPVFYNGLIKAVIELGSLQAYSEKELRFLSNSTHNVGIAIITAENRRRMQELLEETQSQSEELQAQHSELENINAELEAQTEKLQTSEEELRVQQEELQQANAEQEERARLLEERNLLIIEKNAEIQQKAEELEQSTRYKSEFLANMSHELRTPLNSILLLSRLLSENVEQNLTLDQVESATVIQSSGKGLLNLIDEILDLSKIEAGKMDLEYGTISINDIAAAIHALFAPVAADKQLGFRIQLEAGLPEHIETDRMRLEQIIRNLLSNALKFTATGEVSLEISRSAIKQGYIDFTVKDTGIGIPEDKQRIIFEAFQQADGSTRRKYGGTGLGLSISRQLAWLLGGEIRLASEAEKGSAFTISIPAHREMNHVTELVNTYTTLTPAVTPVIDQPTNGHFVAPEIPAEIPDDRQDCVPGEPVILIIEDDTRFANTLLSFTRNRGYKGLVAVQGDQGIEMARQYLPLAILLDLRLPVMDGWQVMDALKRDAVTRHIPVHIMSSTEARKESLLKGAVDFINKPLAIEDMSSIFTRLENALSRNPRKVLIVEENIRHAKALAYYLQTYNVQTEISTTVNDSITALQREHVNCVILDMGVPDRQAYEMLESIKSNPGLEDLPIIIFTGKHLSRAEEVRIRQYADSIVVKTAHSYQRMLDEVALFLHLIEEDKKSPNARQLQKSDKLKSVLQGKTVLIADDDARNIFSLIKALEQHQMNIISATDGKEAIQQLESHPKIDIVLMDMMMPEMDGYETIRRIREKPVYRELPILAVTAKTMVGDREKCIQAGASDYISKPVDIDQLVSLLRVWLYDRL
ncbi:response regulator [Chitinophaga pendula]|uniref:response regulator n=1 Tax=Chitinophaga TaxID=79328 RepID=UPI000BB07419|nr:MULTISPECIES: response regulator [Chitinophaga]ASZ12370.1 histidine kinase [Chitinophaga sp. MD30]UCJ10033.1 response regulator [Chitinophaga pendula]